MFPGRMEFNIRPFLDRQLQVDTRRCNIDKRTTLVLTQVFEGLVTKPLLGRCILEFNRALG